MLLSHRTPFCNEVWPAPIEAVVREVDVNDSDQSEAAIPPAGHGRVPPATAMIVIARPPDQLVGLPD